MFVSKNRVCPFWHCGGVRPQRGHRSITEGTSVASTPGQRTVVRSCTLEGCHTTVTSDIPLIILYSALLEQGNKLVTGREYSMVFLLVDDILDDTLFVCLRVCQGTIALLPFHKSRETVTVGRHEAVGGYLEVVDKRCYSNGGVKTDKHVYMVGHTANAIEQTLVVLAEAEDVHVEVALVGLRNGSRTLMGAEDDVVDKFGVGHDAIWELWMGHPSRVQDCVIGYAVRGCSLRSYPRLMSGDTFSVTGESVGATYIQVPACCLYSMSVDKKMSRRVG